MSTFCRHNRFMADCPICSKGTVLEAGAGRARRRPSSPASPARKRAGADKAAAPAYSGPHVAGPARRDEDDALYLIRLERVPGGVRIGEWRGSALVPRAPVLPAEDLADLVARCGDALQARDAKRLGEALATAPTGRPGADAATPSAPAADAVAGSSTAAPAADDAAGSSAPAAPGAGVSRGRSGDFKEELRIEALDGGLLRVARWVLRPASGWELQDAPPMLPAARYAEALADAARQGLIAPAATPATPSL